MTWVNWLSRWSHSAVFAGCHYTELITCCDIFDIRVRPQWHNLDQRTLVCIGRLNCGFRRAHDLVDEIMEKTLTDMQSVLLAFRSGGGGISVHGWKTNLPAYEQDTHIDWTVWNECYVASATVLISSISVNLFHFLSIVNMKTFSFTAPSARTSNDWLRAKVKWKQNGRFVTEMHQGPAMGIGILANRCFFSFHFCIKYWN